jgi:hypothetical protein
MTIKADKHSQTQSVDKAQLDVYHEGWQMYTLASSRNNQIKLKQDWF